MLIGRLAPVVEPLCGETVAAPFRLAGQVSGQRRLFLQRADARPEGGFDTLGMGFEQRIGRERMADAAAEFLRFVVSRRPDDAVALRTGDAGRPPGTSSAPIGRSPPLGLTFALSSCSFISPSFAWSSGMAGDQPRDFRNWRDVLRARRIDRVLGHLRKQGLAGVLHDGAATIPANDAQTHAAVVQRPGKHDADHPLTVGVRRTAEQRVDRGTMTAFLRSTAELDAAGLEQQLTVARGPRSFGRTRSLRRSRRPSLPGRRRG